MRHLTLVSLTTILLSFGWTNMAVASIGLEAKLKVAYLVNIAKFVKWPNQQQTVNICIDDNSAIHQYATGLSGHSLGNGKQLRIIADPTALHDCNILFWDSSSRWAHMPIKQITNNTDVLLISDMTGSLDNGFTIQFFVRDLKLRFAINEEILQDANYRISSKLLRLSRKLN